MINSSQGFIRPSRWQMAFLALAAVSITIVLALPGTASASTVNCKGKTTLGITDNDVENGQTFQFTCSEAIVAFSLITNQSVDYFTPENAVYLGNPSAGVVTSQSFGCEGPIPGNGYGCKGAAEGPDATGPRFVSGGFATSADPCAKHAKGAGPRAWITVTTLQNDGINKPFYIQSEPFRLGGPGCKAAGGAGARHH